MRRIRSRDPLQRGYSYTLTAPTGKRFDARFTPDLTPRAMLRLGVFGGNYFESAIEEFPRAWFSGAKVAKGESYEVGLNYFRVRASQSRAQWQRNGWIYKDDPRGWFQWYCRYYLGRRIPKEDDRQIRRWLAIRRHIAQLKRACIAGDETCRPVQRQALLHWAYDSRKL